MVVPLTPGDHLRVERVNEYNRSEEEWIQLIGAYEKLGDKEKVREAVNLGRGPGPVCQQVFVQYAGALHEAERI